MTYTYAILQVSESTYNEIKKKLEEAGYEQAFHEHDDGPLIDMHGIALQVAEAHNWVAAGKKLDLLFDSYSDIGPAGFFGGGVIASLKERYDNGERTQHLWNDIQKAE